MFDFTRLTLGVAPTRRDTFPSPADARENSRVMLQRLREIFASIPGLSTVELGEVNDEGLLCSLEDVEKAAALFREKKIDALFVPHANFGQEESVAKLAQALNVPVLLWGPRDGAPEPGVPFRRTDTQCGLFASGRALLRYGIPFTYLENCWLDSPLLPEGIDRFIRTANVVRAFRGMRILQLDTRPRQFLSVKANEGELLERFGIEVTPVGEVEFRETVREAAETRKPEIDALVEQWERTVDLSVHTMEEKKTLAAIELGILTLAERYRCITAASECWSMYRTEWNLRPCFVFGDLAAKGFGVSCEADIHGAVSTVLLQAAARMQTPVFLADLTVRHPQNDNAELLWHCGPFPHTLARTAAGQKPRVLEAHGEWELRGGEVTLCRFDGDRGNYRAFIGKAKGVDGPPTTGTYLWAETPDWPLWERKLVCGPYIHHIAGAHGDYVEALRDAGNYLGFEPDLP